MARSRTTLQGESKHLAAAVKEFADRSMGLIDGHISVGARASIGIGNRNVAEGLTADNPGFFFLGLPLRIEERVRRIGVTVRPAVHGNRFDVVRRIEAGISQHTAELIANVPFKRLETYAHQLDSPGPELIAHREARPA